VLRLHEVRRPSRRRMSPRRLRGKRPLRGTPDAGHIRAYRQECLCAFVSPPPDDLANGADYNVGLPGSTGASPTVTELKPRPTAPGEMEARSPTTTRLRAGLPLAKGTLAPWCGCSSEQCRDGASLAGGAEALKAPLAAQVRLHRFSSCPALVSTPGSSEGDAGYRAADRRPLRGAGDRAGDGRGSPGRQLRQRRPRPPGARARRPRRATRPRTTRKRGSTSPTSPRPTARPSSRSPRGGSRRSQPAAQARSSWDRSTSQPGAATAPSCSSAGTA
jgi:hypothetical protein